MSTGTVYCSATMNYAVADGRSAVDVDVFDARTEPPDDPGREFDERGFTLLHHRSEVADWTDGAEIDEVHRDEVREVFQKLAGCDALAVYPGIVRSPDAARQVADYAPIELVHSDFTHDFHGMVTEADRPYQAFLQPVLDRAGLEHADVRRARRIAMYQLWRNTGPERPDWPFALCDARSVPLERLVPVPIADYGGLRLEFEIFTARPPETRSDDRWYTYPGLRTDEVIALRTFDSERAQHGQPFWTLHSAFADPHVQSGADGLVPHRESVEMRALCLWY